jgi:iron complex outermembrane receptor protein
LAQETAPSPPAVAEVERVVVTGSNIPTAEEIGPNPVDTYRPADIEKLGIRNATDLQTFLPQEAGSTLNLNMGNGDGTVQINLRGLLPRETLVLVDGKRVAFGSLGGAGSSEGEDINLIPFPMIDHIDILKDETPRRVYVPTRSRAWSTSFWSTSSVAWKLEGRTGTQTWEHPTTWASGKHG